MNAIRWSLIVLAFSLFNLAGCNSAPSDNGSGDGNATSAAPTDTETMTVATAILCGKCGEEKGTALCCVAEAETCECGMHKGSPLCCVKLGEDAAGKDICSACGHVAEAGHSCDGDCETCADCGLHQGSPACCKLKS